MDNESYMELAIEESLLALEHGDVPVGAVLVIDDVVVSQAHNQKELTGDPTGHAEMIAIRSAAEKLGDWRLDGAKLFVTLEPCSMCAGAIYLSRIETVVFGAADPNGGACGSLYNICQDSRLNHSSEVVGGVQAGRCSELLKAYFREIRQTRDK